MPEGWPGMLRQKTCPMGQRRRYSGKMQGQSYAHTSNAIVPRKKTSKATTASRSSPLTRPGTLRHSDSSDFALHLPKGLPAALQDPSISNLDPVSRYYMDYYNEHICKLFIVYDSEKNPFRSLIPIGLKDPILLKALLALAARHHANTGKCFRQADPLTLLTYASANREALMFKDQAVESLSRSIQHKTLPTDDATVASIFLLIFLDLLESGSDGWNFHLEGVKKLIDSTYLHSDSEAVINGGPGETVRELRAFITKQIHLIETLGATFLRPRLLSPFTPFEPKEIQPQETIERSFLGCPEYILTAIQCFSTQRDSIAVSPPLDQTSVDSQSKEIVSLLNLVQQFDCYAWASSVQKSRTPSQEEISSLFKLSQAYKVGTLMYGRRIQNALTGEFTIQEELLSELLGLIDSLKDDYLMFKCILWPIFVAGLECQGQAQRHFLERSLEKFWVVTKCLNAVNAAKTLQDYWDQADASEESRSHWIFNIGNLGRDWLWI
ncbi:hypothetical protein N7470_009543 [Penicillium chermesinum]|nr:hypothetical protein N7470_009543 [Penicillium chermesinum]